MRNVLLGTAAICALCLSLPASAADLRVRPVKAPPALVSPAFNWSGFYVGVHAGYTFGEDENIVTTGQAPGNIANVVGGARPGLVRLDRDGFIGGGQIGYNWQFNPNWVFGLEADISYVDSRETINVGTLSLPNAAPPECAAQQYIPHPDGIFWHGARADWIRVGPNDGLRNRRFGLR